MVGEIWKKKGKTSAESDSVFKMSLMPSSELFAVIPFKIIKK